MLVESRRPFAHSQDAGAVALRQFALIVLSPAAAAPDAACALRHFAQGTRLRSRERGLQEGGELARQLQRALEHAERAAAGALRSVHEKSTCAMFPCCHRASSRLLWDPAAGLVEATDCAWFVTPGDGCNGLPPLVKGPGRAEGSGDGEQRPNALVPASRACSGVVGSIFPTSLRRLRSAARSLAPCRECHLLAP